MIIKQIPEDFKVDEVINLKLKESGEQTYFWLTKKNWTTEAALQTIARRCGISYRRFKFAGTKDKFAVTKQAISVFKILPERLQKITIKDINIEIIGTGENPISIGSLDGNRFEIIIRDLNDTDVDNITRRAEENAKNGFLNLFGQQRFGRGNTALIGKAILQGNLENAVKEILCFPGEREGENLVQFRKYTQAHWSDWKNIRENLPKHLRTEDVMLRWLEKLPTDFAGALRTVPKHIRKLYVHAFQSMIWNTAVKENADIIKYEELPIPGWKTELGNDAFAQSLKKLLEKEGIQLADFKCARMPEVAVEGELRLGRVVPTKLNVSSSEDDDLNIGKKKLHLSFNLPKGCYATVFLDSIIE